jgi:methylaspartate ammonia-lyase|tara:strand:- start:744 stop:974 length:231 start_codon:yes stop_codon:yes gene_type:complete
MTLKSMMLDALKTKYQGDYKQAHATLEIYLTNPVGIGEHPQQLEEMDKLVAAMAEATDKLNVINTEYLESQKELLV